jgi:cell division protein FtsI/penicillin-binding protein 2
VDEKETPYEHRDHAWFVAYAPAENPVISVAVLVEHGGHGASASAPIAREVMKKYLHIIKEEGKSTALIARKKKADSLNSRGSIR